jgi:c-di-GMP-binding flagellar brake protein YcgR
LSRLVLFDILLRLYNGRKEEMTRNNEQSHEDHDQRDEPRVPVLRNGAVHLGRNDEAPAREVSFVDISATGCQILLINRADDEPVRWPADGICLLHLSLVGQPVMELEAKVVWTQPCGEDGVLAGFQFSESETEQTHQLSHFIGRRLRAGLQRGLSETDTPPPPESERA